MLTYSREEQLVQLMFKVGCIGFLAMFCWNRPLGCIDMRGKYHRFLCQKEHRDGITTYSLCILPFTVAIAKRAAQ